MSEILNLKIFIRKYALVKKIIELLIKIKVLFDEKSNICICIYMYIETVER